MANEITGDQGKVDIGGTVLNVTGWELNPTAEMHDVSNTGGAGWATFIAGLKGATGRLSMNWDSAVSPTSTPPNVNAGVSAVGKFYLGGGSKYFEATILISSTPVTSAVRGVVTYAADFTVTGAVTNPIDA